VSYRKECVSTFIQLTLKQTMANKTKTALTIKPRKQISSAAGHIGQKSHKSQCVVHAALWKGGQRKETSQKTQNTNIDYMKQCARFIENEEKSGSKSCCTLLRSMICRPHPILRDVCHVPLTRIWLILKIPSNNKKRFIRNNIKWSCNPSHLSEI